MIYYFIFGTAFIFVLVLAIVSFILVYQNKTIKQKIAMKDAELKKQEEIYLALILGEEKERERVALELHDGVIANLAGVKMLYEDFIFCISDKIISEGNKSKSERVLSALKEVIAGIRQTSHKLQPAFFDGKLLKPALENLIDNFNSYRKCRFELLYENIPENLSANFKLNCFRIINELSMNVINHSMATQTKLQLTKEDKTLHLVVEDNGVGFNLDEIKEGIGLSNIKHRLKFYSGTLKIEPNSTGTKITIQFPLEHLWKTD